MVFKKIFIFIAFITLPVLLTACTDDNKDGITITDMAGIEVVVPKNVEKVAAVSPSTADLMIAFGLGDKIDGVYKTVTDNEWQL